jgi:hypothetical protein
VSFVLTVQNTKTVGDNRCAGCDRPVCITLLGITVSQAPAKPTPIRLTNPLANAQITWNAKRAPKLCDTTRPGGSSLRQVKGLYRE